MGGRRFTQYNASLPACVEAMAKNTPRCFDATIWRLYLTDVWREALNDKRQQSSLARGKVPDYCAACTPGYRAEELSAGRCHPPKGATVPEAEGTSV